MKKEIVKAQQSAGITQHTSDAEVKGDVDQCRIRVNAE